MACSRSDRGPGAPTRRCLRLLLALLALAGPVGGASQVPPNPPGAGAAPPTSEGAFAAVEIHPRPVADAMVLHAAPTGSAQADGSAARPYSIEQAQQAVREVPDGRSVTVELADGTYVLRQPLRFAAADGGRNGTVVEWRARPRGRGRFSPEARRWPAGARSTAHETSGRLRCLPASTRGSCG